MSTITHYCGRYAQRADGPRKRCARCIAFDLTRWLQWVFGRLRRALSFTIDLRWFGRLFICPEFKLADFWIGAFWRTHRGQYLGDSDSIWKVEVWICIVPCFPIYVSWTEPADDPEEVPF